MKACGVFKARKTNAYDLCCFYCASASREFQTFATPCKPASHDMLKRLLETAWVAKCTHLLMAFAGDSTMAICLLHDKDSMKCFTLELKPGKQDADSKPVKNLSFCPFCLYHGSNDISYMNHIVTAHYNAANV